MASVHLAGWLAVLFIGVSSGIGYCLWQFGAAILGEGVSAPSIAGLVCVITGLWSAKLDFGHLCGIAGCSDQGVDG